MSAGEISKSSFDPERKKTGDPQYITMELSIAFIDDLIFVVTKKKGSVLAFGYNKNHRSVYL